MQKLCLEVHNYFSVLNFPLDLSFTLDLSTWTLITIVFHFASKAKG